MSHSTSHRTPDEPSREEGPAVKSALKATLARQLAEESSKAGATVTPEHLAGPGRLRGTLRS
jgi:hypothetical protein